ncbi:hypothetical protein [Blastopirellula retiformator]|nr:hypothetical protein [Blastopirellula retiformator]
MSLLVLGGWILLEADGGASWNALVAWRMADPAGEMSHAGAARASPNACFLMAWLLSVGGLSLAIAWGTILVGPRGYRNLRCWLATITLTGAWLGFFVNVQELVWSGYRYRLQTALPHCMTATGRLQADWPRRDGEREPWGPYMAYPIARPTMLMLMTTPEISPGIRASSIERSHAGGVRLELAGEEQGVWLEWHPPGELPDSFLGGLEDPHTLRRWSALGDGWFVVKYQ